MEIKDFNAQKAREIVDSHYEDELYEILTDIENLAKDDQSVLHVNNPLKEKTLNEIKNRGFEIYVHPSIGTQKDGLYYSIRW